MAWADFLKGLGGFFKDRREALEEPQARPPKKSQKARPLYRPALLHAEDDDPTGVTELRVHGVGGTPPEDILGEPHTKLVAGDKIAGFYRGSDESDGRQVEAYSWGGLTSRSASRAWWLVLLPFALVNVAGWMHVKRGRDALVARLVRAVALVLSASYVLWLAFISMSLLGYQCGGDDKCISGRWWLAAFEEGWLRQHAGHRLAFTALVPLVFILALLYVGRKSRRRYEEQSVRDVGLEGDDHGLDDPKFWFKAAHVRRLGWIHAGTAFAMLALAISLAITSLPQTGRDSRSITEGTADLAGWILWAAIFELVALLVLAMLLEHPPAADRDKPRYSGWIWMVTAAAVATLAIALAQAALMEGGTLELPVKTIASLPRIGHALRALFIAQTTLIVLLLLVLVVERFVLTRKEHRQKAYWGGPFVTSVLGILILDAFFAGASMRFAEFLGRGIDGHRKAIEEGDQAILIYPISNKWFSLGFLFALVVLILLAAGTAVWHWRREHNEETLAAIEAEYDELEGPTEDPTTGELEGSYSSARDSWLNRIALWRTASRVADQAGWLLGVLVSVSVACVIASVWIRRNHFDSWKRPPEWLDSVFTTSSWVLGLLPFVMIWLVRRGEKNPNARRKIGILWDVLTVWPRHFHPFAPPCYAERAVPELQKRILKLTRKGKVILSGHSQGAVLSVLTMFQLPPDRRRRVALITYGSPVTRLYRRFFPAWFGGGKLVELGTSLVDQPRPGEPARWQNFHRGTDPIGGPTFIPPDAVDDDGEVRVFEDVYLLDPYTRRQDEGGAWIPVAGHSNYLVDPLMTMRLREVATALLERDDSDDQ